MTRSTGSSDMKKRSYMLLGSMLLLLCLSASFASAAKGIFPLPESREMFLYSAAAYPLEDRALSTTKPVGIGTVAEGGDSFNLQVSIGTFARPVDMYLTLLSPDDKQGSVLSLRPDNTFETFSGSMRPWRKRVTAAGEFIMDVPVSSLASGPYVLMFAVMPADNSDRYYLWTVPFLVP